MAMRMFGLGGVLTFNTTKAQAAMQRARKSFLVLGQAAKRLGAATATVARKTARMGMTVGKGARSVVRGFRRMLRAGKRTFRYLISGMTRLRAAAAHMKSAFMGLGFAAIPMVMGMKKAIGTASDFESAMAELGSVMKTKTGPEFEALNQKAKELGIKSQFSAQQSAQAMTALRRNGFETNEIMTSISDTLALAAVEEMNLADAANIVSSNVRAFGLEAKQAGMVTDVMAATSANTGATVTSLAEGLKLAAPMARNLGIDIKETSAALGILADANIKGTLGGTALKNALTKLAAPTGKAMDRFKQLRLKIKDSRGNFIGLEKVLKQVATGVNKMGGNVDQAGALSELFGLRGINMSAVLKRLQKGASGGAKSFGELKQILDESAGSAQKMADIRLDTLAGAMTLLKSSAQAAMIEIFEPLLGPMKDAVKGFLGDRGKGGLNDVLFTLQDLKKLGPEGVAKFTAEAVKAGKPLTVIQQIALGIFDAIQEMKKSWTSMVERIKEAGAWISKRLGGDGVRSLTRMIIKFGAMAGAIAPVIIIVGLLGFLLGRPLISILKAVGLAFRFAFSIPGLIIIALIGIILSFKRENESLVAFMKRAWGAIGKVIEEVWTNRLKPFVLAIRDTLMPAIMPLFEAVGSLFGAIFDLLGTLFGITTDTAAGTKRTWKQWGKDVGRFLGGVAAALGAIIDFVAQGIKGIGWLIDEVKVLLGLAERKKGKKITTGRVGEALRGAEVGQTLIHAERRAGLERGALKSATGEKRAKMLQRLASVMTSKQVGKLRQGEVDVIGKHSIVAFKQLVAELEKERKKTAVIKPEVKIDDQRTIVNKNTLCVDGKAVASAVARHQVEIHERSGFKKQPWRQRAELEHGALNVTTSGGGS